LGASTITSVKKIVFVTLSHTHRTLTMSAYVASINTVQLLNCAAYIGVISCNE
jgi:hypothetical protein